MRPWVLRALVMTAVYGVGQAAFVALRGSAPELSTLWTLIFLGVLLAVGVVWAGGEVVLGRTPEEWSWFRAALAAGPSAGVLTWLLLIILVDGSGVADLGAALVGRASFTALLIMGSTFVGTRLGWLSLSRRGEGDGDPMLDRDDTDPDEIAAMSASGSRGTGGPLPTATMERVVRRRRGRAGGLSASSPEGPTELIGGVSPEDDEVYRGDRGRVGSAAPTEVAVSAGVASAGVVSAGSAGAGAAGVGAAGATPPTASSPSAGPDPAPEKAVDPDPVGTRPTDREPAAAGHSPAVAPADVGGADAPRPGVVPADARADVAARDTPSRDEWQPAVEPVERSGDRTARFAPPVVAVLPESDPRFPRSTGPGDGMAGADGRPGPDDSDGADGSDGPSGDRGPRRSVAEAARAARIARAQAQRDEKRGGDEKRRRGPRRPPGR